MRYLYPGAGLLAIAGIGAVLFANTRLSSAAAPDDGGIVSADLVSYSYATQAQSTSGNPAISGGAIRNCSCDCAAACAPSCASGSGGSPECTDTTGCGCTTGCDDPMCCDTTPVSLDPYCRLLPQDGFIRARGWVDAGVLGNTASPGSRFNGPYNSQQVDNGQFNQAYFIFDRLLAADGSFSVGGRFDMLYGSDYFEAQSRGLEQTRAGAPKWNSSQYYGLALPQAYVELGTTKASVKLGHFYTVVGYESVQAANNFFYSHAYSYQFAGPFTQWGGMGNWQVNDNWQIQAGGVNGWNALDETSNHISFLSNIKYTSDRKDWWSSFAIITGDEGSNPAGLATVKNAVTNRTRYSFIVSKTFAGRTEYVFHQWLGAQQQGGPGGRAAMWYGIDQYLYHRLNDNWRVGTRVEWFRDEDGTRVGLTEPSNPNKAPLPGSYASWTIGANWTPTRNLSVRPELRWDTYNGTAKPFDDGTKTHQLLLGADAIVQF